MYPSTDADRGDDLGEESKDEIEKSSLEVLGPKQFNPPEHALLDPYAKDIDPKEIERLKNKYQIDFYTTQSSELFCHQLEDTIVRKVKELENCQRDLDNFSDPQDTWKPYQEALSNKIAGEANLYKKGQGLVEETKKLLSDYEQYVDAISPEVAKVYNIPEEFKLTKYGRNFNVKETLDYIEKVDFAFGDVDNENKSHLQYTTSSLEHKPLNSFSVIRQEDPETKEVSYKLFRKNDFTKDNQAENNLAVTDTDEWGYASFETYYDNKGLKYFKDNPKEQLRLLAKLFKLYDLPEFNVGQIDFHTSIKAIRDRIQAKHDTFSAHDPSLYIKQRKFLTKNVDMFEHLSSYLGHTHQTNQLRRLDEKGDPDYLKAQ